MYFFDITRLNARRLCKYYELKWPLSHGDQRPLPGGCTLFHYHHADRLVVMAKTTNGADMPPGLILSGNVDSLRPSVQFKRPKKKKEKAS